MARHGQSGEITVRRNHIDDARNALGAMCDYTSLLLSQCATVATSSYLITGTPPPSGLVCQQDIVPFTMPLTSTASTFEIEARRQVRGSLISQMLQRAAPVKP